MVESVLHKNGMTKTEIDLYILHQANKYMLDMLRKILKIEEEKFYLYLSEVGNTVSSSIPIALCAALRTGYLRRGTKTLLAGFGVGLSWGGCVLK